MKFYKYHCLENDFIITEDNYKDIILLCDQHKGIGADGFIIIQNENISFFNKDGTKAKMCGNGIRCAAKYLNDYHSKSNLFKFEDKYFKITNNKDNYILYYSFLKYKQIKNMYLVNGDVDHLILFEKYNKKKAIKLLNKYKCNITFCFNNFVQTYELGVGETRGCGSGLIAVMNVLYLENNTTNIELYSPGGKSLLKIEDNNILLESKVYEIYKGEILC